MAHIKTSTIPEQVAVHLREGIARGRWGQALPGRDILATELGVSPRSVQKATSLLENEGLIERRGQGKSRLIRKLDKGLQAKPVRVGLLLFTKEDRKNDYVIELRHQLDDVGHIPIIPQEGQQELGMNVNRVARLVNDTAADAWVVMSGSREILQWFVDQDIKVFAWAGRRFELPIAGAAPQKFPYYGGVTRQLIKLGHRKIVLLVHEQLRLPQPSRSVGAFLEAMESEGVPVGNYNLPHWGESREDFLAALDSLFRTTPPTALILDEPHLFHAAYHYLAQRNLRVPQDVSLVCTDGDEGFAWCRPSIAHIAWDSQPLVRRVIRWVNNVARGVDDRRQSFTKAIYVEGGTVAPPAD